MSTTSVIDTGDSLRCMTCQKVWCDHIKEYIQLEEDRGMMRPGLNVLIPMFPTYNLFTKVSIAEESYPGVALMEMNHEPEFGVSQRIALGFWNEGEGRLSIRKVIIDWLKAQYPHAHRGVLRCPATTHTFQQVNSLASMLDADPSGAFWPNAWAMKMEEACIPCIRLAASTEDLVPNPDDRPPWQGWN